MRNVYWLLIVILTMRVPDNLIALVHNYHIALILPIVP
jgi:hypothetical protein